MLSSTTKYALRALVYLRAQNSQDYISIDILAEHTEVPREYLAKITKALVAGGILESKRGQLGGVRLLKRARGKSVFQICELLDDPVVKEKCFLGNKPCGKDGYCEFHEHWGPLRERLTSYLRKAKAT